MSGIERHYCEASFTPDVARQTSKPQREGWAGRLRVLWVAYLEPLQLGQLLMRTSNENIPIFQYISHDNIVNIYIYI